MGRPLGSKNKKTDISGIPTAIAMNPGGIVPKEATIPVLLSPGTFEKLPPKVRYDLNLSIRAFRTGNWKGLWELSTVNNEGKRTIIIDATSRQSVINMVNRQIMKMVIG